MHLLRPSARETLDEEVAAPTAAAAEDPLFVVCAWDGQTFILNKDGDVLKLFVEDSPSPSRISAFVAGRYLRLFCYLLDCFVISKTVSFSSRLFCSLQDCSGLSKTVLFSPRLFCSLQDCYVLS